MQPCYWFDSSYSNIPNIAISRYRDLTDPGISSAWNSLTRVEFAYHHTAHLFRPSRTPQVWYAIHFNCSGAITGNSSLFSLFPSESEVGNLNQESALEKKSQDPSTNVIRTFVFSFVMAPSSNSTSRYLSVGYSGNRSSSAPPSTSTETSSTFIRTSEAPQYCAIVIHPTIEAQTISFNDSLETSEDITQMSNYSSSPSDYSYSLSACGTVNGSNQNTISQVSEPRYIYINPNMWCGADSTSDL